MSAASMSAEYISSKPEEKISVFAATEKHLDLSAEIAAMYVAALGVGGVGQSGAEPYPDPDLFSEEGVKSTLMAQERLIAVARHEGEIVGAMVADRLSPFHVEFNSMAVRMGSRGLGIGSALVEGLKEIIEQSQLTFNTTELVTHSLASQAAHFRAGYRAIVGFAFCHYPSVFFVGHPESVLWVSRIQGKLVSAGKQIRNVLGRNLGDASSDLVQKVTMAQAQGLVRLREGRLNEEQLQVVAELLQHRTVYVPSAYADIVQSILFQFEDLLDRTVKSKFFQRADEPDATACQSVNKVDNVNKVDRVYGVEEKELYAEQNGHNQGPAEAFIVDLKEGHGHSYITFNPGFKFDQETLSQSIESLKARSKRYILVRLPANQTEALTTAQYLRSEAFVFHSFVPLYGYSRGGNLPRFHDVLTLQWIAPQVVANNCLPGETNSVIKLHGYPENLSGPLVKLIASELGRASWSAWIKK